MSQALNVAQRDALEALKAWRAYSTDDSGYPGLTAATLRLMDAADALRVAEEAAIAAWEREYLENQATHERQVRENVAQEIEARAEGTLYDGAMFRWDAFHEAAAIARNGERP